MAYKIVDFYCPKCGILEERFIKDDKTQKCTLCSGEMVKQISAPGMVKGNFYNDKAGIRR